LVVVGRVLDVLGLVVAVVPAVSTAGDDPVEQAVSP
jgi:hypothetical protein